MQFDDLKVSSKSVKLQRSKVTPRDTRFPLNQTDEINFSANKYDYFNL